MGDVTYVGNEVDKKTQQMSFVQDENENPNTSTAVSVTSLTKTRAETILHEGDDDSFFDVGSASFVEARKQLIRPENLIHQTPSARKAYVHPNIRKRRSNLISGEVFSNLKFTSLPNEVINHIFTYLNRRDLFAAGQTCYRFFNISANSAHWKNLNMTNKNVLESAFHRLISRRTQNACLRNASVHADRALFSREFTMCCLVRLDLTCTNFAKPEMVTAILKRCTNLEYLSLESQRVLPVEVYTYIARNNKLKLLNLANCKKIPADSLEKVFTNCPLTEVSLNFSSLDSAASEVVVNHLPSTVTKLALSGFDMPFFVDQNMIKLIVRLPHLAELDIDDNSYLSNDFMTVLSNCPNLRKLSMSRCYGVDPYAFTLFTGLKILNIYGNLSNAGYKFIRDHMPKTIINHNHLSTIARAVDEYCFWDTDISDRY